MPQEWQPPTQQIPQHLQQSCPSSSAGRRTGSSRIRPAGQQVQQGKKPVRGPVQGQFERPAP